MTRIIAVIPARGGSKRIPGKNIKTFGGKPMIAHSILAAKAAGLFERIVVSTDSDAIAAMARQWGAEVPFVRPAELSDDFVRTDDVFVHAVRECERLYGRIDYACFLYATAPFMRPEDIRKGYEALHAEKASTAFAVTTYSYPIFRGLRVNAAGRLELIWPENMNTRSQDLPDAVHDAGQFYWADAQAFLNDPDLFFRDTVPVRVPRHLVQDIDTLEDWERAERMYEVMRLESSRTDGRPDREQPK